MKEILGIRFRTRIKYWFINSFMNWSSLFRLNCGLQSWMNLNKLNNDFFVTLKGFWFFFFFLSSPFNFELLILIFFLMLILIFFWMKMIRNKWVYISVFLRGKSSKLFCCLKSWLKKWRRLIKLWENWSTQLKLKPLLLTVWKIRVLLKWCEKVNSKVCLNLYSWYFFKL